MSTTEVLYPVGYTTQRVPLERLREIHEPRMHPEFARRLFAWIEERAGTFGIGGGWRPGGAQPDRPGFAPEGKSFHQSQEFASGVVAYCAVDLVVAVRGTDHRTPRWSEVPAQGSDEAAAWGLHCNVGAPAVVGSEPWHMQPVEIDGWARWDIGGRPEPVAGIPLPSDPPPDPDPIEEDEAMFNIDLAPNTPAWVRVALAGTLAWIRGTASHVTDRLKLRTETVSRTEMRDLIVSCGTSGPSPWDQSQPGHAPVDTELDWLWKANAR